MKILLGGIPLGCDNVGDEAILASVVRLLRGSIPDAEITVCTNDPLTAGRLSVAVAQPYGFAGVPVSGFGQEAARHDAYVWCGATGLSDYPNAALDLLDAAQRAGVRTYVWGVGMDDELNPAFFKASGRRGRLLGVFGLSGLYERSLRLRLRRRIMEILPRCRGVWLRDEGSAAVLAGMGFGAARVAADSAIAMARGFGGAGARRPMRVGLCISAQRKVRDMDGAGGFVAALRSAGAEVVGIPMNPKTDRPVLESIGVGCIGDTEPEDVQRAAGECALVVSSRLHLLILAANAGTQIVGIERGSKIRNWLAEFGLAPDGTVADCDWQAIAAHSLRLLGGASGWPAARAAAYARMDERLDSALAEFTRALRTP